MIKAKDTRYVVETIEKETTTSSGIILKDTGESQLARILSVGEKVDHPEAVGAEVFLEWGACAPIKINNKTYWVVDQRNVLGVYCGENS